MNVYGNIRTLFPRVARIGNLVREGRVGGGGGGGGVNLKNLHLDSSPDGNRYLSLIDGKRNPVFWTLEIK